METVLFIIGYIAIGFIATIVGKCIDHRDQYGVEVNTLLILWPFGIIVGILYAAGSAAGMISNQILRGIYQRKQARFARNFNSDVEAVIKSRSKK